MGGGRPVEDRGHFGGHVLRAVERSPLPHAVGDHVDAGIERHALRLEVVRVDHQDEARAGGRLAKARQHPGAGNGERMVLRESPLDERLHADRARGLHARHRRLGRVLLGLRALGKGRGLPGIDQEVGERLVGAARREEGHRVAIGHRHRFPAVMEVGVQRRAAKAFERRLVENDEVDQRRIAEVQVRARQLPEIRADHRGVERRGVDGSREEREVDVGIDEARNEEPAAAMDHLRPFGRLRLAPLDGNDASVLEKHASLLHAIEAFRRHDHDVRDPRPRREGWRSAEREDRGEAGREALHAD